MLIYIDINICCVRNYEVRFSKWKLFIFFLVLKMPTPLLLSVDLKNVDVVI